MNTIVAPCTCEHSFQDKTYGSQRRVHNKTERLQGSQHVYRCTVCQSTRLPANAARKQGKEKTK